LAIPAFAQILCIIEYAEATGSCNADGITKPLLRVLGGRISRLETVFLGVKKLTFDMGIGNKVLHLSYEELFLVPWTRKNQ
jgi:hypothetical protein